MSRQSLMIRASAGSGKTYQLANRFLALLALGVAPASIIALTFTRKAAGEFSDRILRRLAEGAESEASAARLASELTRVIHGQTDYGQPGLIDRPEDFPTLDQTRFQQLLESVVRSLDRLSLGTIDAFFTRIAKTSWNDLGLSGFTLLEEDARQAEKDRAFARIFSRLGNHADEREDFLQAFKLATFGTDENRFVDKLESFIDSHHQRFLATPDPEAWGGESRLWPDGSPWPKFQAKEFRQNAEKLRSLTTGRAWGHAGWVKAWEKFLEFCDRYEPGRPKLEIPQGERLLPVLGDLRDGQAEVVYSRKTMVFDGEVAVVLHDLLGAVLGAEIRVRLAQTRGLCQVMGHYEQLYDLEVRQRGKLDFSGLTMVLARAGIGDSGMGQNIGYRIDQWFDHWMLDEFQDTSRLQWQVLSGLIQEVQQDEERQRTFFVVGDPKQGVHAWRGGEPRLFQEIARDWQGRLPEWTLSRSFRSAPAVLELVNRVCDPSGPGMREFFPEPALARWEFSPHSAARDIPGQSVVIEVVADPAMETSGDTDDLAESAPADAPGDDDDEPADLAASKPTWPAIVALLEKYQPLGRGLSCAILVQTNKTARAIGEYVRACLPAVPVEVESETPMEDDGPLAATLLDFFRWLHTPADGLAWGHVAHSPLFPALRNAFGDSSAGPIWRAARGEFHRGGVQAVLLLVTRALRAALPLDAFQLGRLDDWELEARRFDARGGTLRDWLRFLESWKVREYSGSGAVQIMTVHKAKGLEFSMVILPDLDGAAFDNVTKLAMIEDITPGGRVNFLTMKPPVSVAGQDPALARMIGDWKAERAYERFCTFYVAMTRAARGLFLILPEGKTLKNGEPAPVKANQAGWLRRSLDGVDPAGASFDLPGVSTRLLWSAGEATWIDAHPVVATDAIAPEAPVCLAAWSPRPRARTPSGEKMDTAGKIANAATDRRGAMEFGAAVHAAFEAVEWIDSPPDPSDANPVIAAMIARCLAAPAIRALFSRPPGEVVLWREQPFDCLDGDTWISGVMDRVHVHREKGAPVRAEIIDFKTDRVDDPAVLGEKYGPQMQAYRMSLARALGINPADIRCLLLATRVAELYEIPPP